jgi:hypothetical protein
LPETQVFTIKYSKYSHNVQLFCGDIYIKKTKGVKYFFSSPRRRLAGSPLPHQLSPERMKEHSDFGYKWDA